MKHLAIALALLLAAALPAHAQTAMAILLKGGGCSGVATTLSPTDSDAAASGGTFSGGNLTASINNALNVLNARSTKSFASGKIAFEVTVSAAGGAQHAGFGFANASQGIGTGNFLGDSTNSLGFYGNGNMVQGGTFSGLDGSAPGVGTYGFYWDIGNNLLWETSNGTTYNSASSGATPNPSTGVNGFATSLAAGPYFPAVSLGNDSVGTDTLTVNYGATAFAYSLPTGFSAVGTTGCVAGAPPPPPIVGGNMLNGISMGQTDSPTFSAMMGYPPDYATAWNSSTQVQTATGPIGNGFNPPSGAQSTYPFLVEVAHYDSNTAGFGDPVAAANGSYNSGYQQWVNAVGPYAGQIYAIRVDWEWTGPWNTYSPFQGNSFPNESTEKVSPATWIAGFRNFVSVVRADSRFANVKIEWDYYGTAIEQNYYPGDDVVDIIGFDYYFQTLGSTSIAAWDQSQTNVGIGLGYGSLPQMAAFAAARGKPQMVPEWGDPFGDGYCILHFGEWMKGHNVVAQSYWDNLAGGVPAPTPIQANAASKAAYIKEFGNLPYTGTYWPQKYPIPASLPPGF